MYRAATSRCLSSELFVRCCSNTLHPTGNAEIIMLFELRDRCGEGKLEAKRTCEEEFSLAARIRNAKCIINESRERRAHFLASSSVLYLCCAEADGAVYCTLANLQAFAPRYAKSSPMPCKQITSSGLARRTPTSRSIQPAHPPSSIAPRPPGGPKTPPAPQKALLTRWFSGAGAWGHGAQRSEVWR